MQTQMGTIQLTQRQEAKGWFAGMLRTLTELQWGTPAARLSLMQLREQN